MQHERLQIQEPEGRCEHRSNDDCEKNSRARVTENSQRRRAEGTEVTHNSEGRCWDSGDAGINATKNNRTTLRRPADGAIAGEVRDSEIRGISQPAQSN